MWRNVGSNTNLRLHVVQAGYQLLFYYDSDGVIGGEVPMHEIDLQDFTAPTALGTPSEPLQMADIRGDLFVVGQYMRPLRIHYTNVNGAQIFEVDEIAVEVRDFWGIEDNVGILDRPTAESITAAHSYNLQIRGFSKAAIADFFGSKDFYPAKNLVHFRAYTSNASDSFIWDTAQLEATAFGRASAPTGHIIIDPLDTTKIGNYVGAVGMRKKTVDASDFSPASPTFEFSGAEYNLYLAKRFGPNPFFGGQFSSTGDTITQKQEQKLTVQLTLRLASGLNVAVNDTIKLEDCTLTYNAAPYKYKKQFLAWKRVFSTVIGGLGTALMLIGLRRKRTSVDISGTYTVLARGDEETIGNDTVGYRSLTIALENFNEVYLDAKFNDKATVSKAAGGHGEGYLAPNLYKAVASYAGRICYAGAENPKTADVVYYSQVLDGADRYADCYQEADPTNETNNILIDSDGGQIQIPELEGVVAMRPYQSSLLVFSKRGVWELSGGNQKYFSATNYEIRKLSDVHCVSGSGIAVGEQGVIFVAREGVMIIAPSENGYLRAQNISEGTIQKLWNEIPNERQDKVKIVYDTVLKRAHILYTDDPTMPLNAFTKALIFDLRLQAFYKYNYGGNPYNYITTAFISDANRSIDSRGRVKYISYEPPFFELAFNDMDSLQFYDFTGIEAPAFIETGWDAPNNTVQKTQACYMKVYMRRTDTDLLNGTTVNPASLTAQTKWGWADSGIGGKYGRLQQVYKRRRAQVVNEADTVLDDGTPVLCTKLKVRGRGEVLSIRFEGEAGKDAHLIGWATNYKIRRTS